ncbi:MAG: MASE1 domain-containing protein [Proteobacteria bacterium]|nr:MASE1 domain-containing protein [Pseudomonadota bacterium]
MTETAKVPLAPRPALSGGRLRAAGAAIGFFVAYCVLDRLALLLPDTSGVTPWNLSAGLALAAFVLMGPRIGPVVFAAELASSMINPAPAVPLIGGFASALGVTVAYGGFGCAIHRRINPSLERQRDLVLLLVAALGAAALAAALNTVVVITWGGVDPAQGLDSVYRGWTGDFLGECLLTPAILVLPRWRLKGGLAGWLEGLLQALMLLGFVALVFVAGPTNRVRIYYILFLPQIWIAVRSGMAAVTLSNLAVQAGVLASLFTKPDADNLIFEFQFRLLALALSGLFLAVTVTERRVAEAALADRQEELSRFSRLSAAGEMAAALAHELNQPLMAVVAFARAAKRFAPESSATEPRFVEAIDGAASEAERAGAIVRSLRQFIARGAPERRRLAPAALIADAASLMQAESRRAEARIVTAVDRDLPSVQADRVQIQQVLVNLLQNALNALTRGEHPVRQVTVSAGLAEGGMVEFEVADTADGMPAEVAARLFSPFPGGDRKGLGLGLMICRGVVEAHGGRIWLAENRPGRCAVRFTLPIVARTVGSSPP